MKPHRLEKPTYSVNQADWQEAEKEYGTINCGPTALAIMVGLPVSAVMPHIPHYKERHYTSPTMMKQALASLGVKYHERRDPAVELLDRHTLCQYGLVRIQWEGPWTAESANPKWAYRQTHWVGSASFVTGPTGMSLGQEFVFDVNSGWRDKRKWESVVVPSIISECVKRGNGKWFATHRWELEFVSTDELTDAEAAEIASQVLSEAEGEKYLNQE